MNQPTIIDLCRAGDFLEAQQRLEALGESCRKDPDNYAMCSAYADLCSVFEYYLARRKKVYPSKFMAGTLVYYHPIIGQLPRYAGITDGNPRLLGGHTWVVNLCSMDPAYEYAATKDNRVCAACLEALEQRES